MSFPKLGVKPVSVLLLKLTCNIPLKRTQLLGTTPTHVTRNSTDEPPSASQAKALLWEASVSMKGKHKDHTVRVPLWLLRWQVAAGMLLRPHHGSPSRH